MRLIHLADYGGTYPGSFVPMVRAVLDAGRRRRWNVQAVFSQVAHNRGWLRELREEGFRCELAPTEGRHLPAKLLEEIAYSDEPTILHTHFTSFDLPAAAAARRNDHVIAYWHLHSALRRGPWWQLRQAVKLGLLSKGVEEMLCVAPNIVDQARRHLAPRDRLALVPNAIDLTRFPPATPEHRRLAREALSLPVDARVVLHFGWDWHRKGGDVFLKAIASLTREGMDDLMALTVAEEQPASSLADSLGIAEHVRTLAPSDDVRRLYAAADVFAAPSRGEGHPFAVAEALASGLPVVASPLPGHEMIARRVRACRIVALNPSALAGALAATLGESTADGESERRAARDWVVAEMDILPWAERMLMRYDGALARR
jgi:glycosyltransferase involved in cell wall biosynthesis